MKQIALSALFLLLLVSLSSSPAFANQFQALYDVNAPDDGFSVIQATSGDYIVAGIHDRNGGGSGVEKVVMAMRIDEDGTVLHKKEFLFADVPVKVLVREMNGDFGFIINFEQSSNPLKKYLSFLSTDGGFNSLTHITLTNPADPSRDFELVDIETHLAFPGWVGSLLVVANVNRTSGTMPPQPYGMWVGRVDVSGAMIWADVLHDHVPGHVMRAQDICEDNKTFCWWITGSVEHPGIPGSQKVMYFYTLINGTFGPFHCVETGGSDPVGLRIWADNQELAIAGTHQIDTDPEQELFLAHYKHDSIADSLICASSIDFIPNAPYQSPEVMADLFYEPARGFTIVGNTVTANTGYWNMYMLRVNNCVVDWAYRYGKLKRKEFIRDGVQALDGYTAFGSMQDRFTTDQDYYMVKTDFDGESGCLENPQNTQIIPFWPFDSLTPSFPKSVYYQLRWPVAEQGFPDSTEILCFTPSCTFPAYISASSLTIKSGGTVTLIVNPPQNILFPNTYEWYLDGVLMPGVTGNVLFAATQPGTYTVVITNYWGCTATVSVTITYDPCKWSGNPAGPPSELSLYPNPGNGRPFVVWDGTGEVEVWDQMGKMLFRRPVNGKCQLDLSNFSSGVYRIRVLEKGTVVKEKPYMKN